MNTPNGFNHELYVEATLRSPNGRVAYASQGYEMSTSVVASVFLPWDDNDLGQYVLDGVHRDFCPVVVNYFFLGTTQPYRIIADSRTCYKLRPNSCDDENQVCPYDRVVPCNVNCPASYIVYYAAYSEMPPGPRPPGMRLYIRWTQKPGEAPVCQPNIRGPFWEDCDQCKEVG